jgi:hypothetical protein
LIAIGAVLPPPPHDEHEALAQAEYRICFRTAVAEFLALRLLDDSSGEKLAPKEHSRDGSAIPPDDGQNGALFRPERRNHLGSSLPIA